ncbi:MAG: RDD family protein [Gemmataceae bacterium]
MPWPDSDLTVSHASARIGSKPPGSSLARLAAAVLDFLVLAVAKVPVAYGVALAFELVVRATGPEALGPENIQSLQPAWSVTENVTLFLLFWLYFAWLESSPAQATLGKRLMGLTVTGENGRRISFVYAAIRFLLKAACMLTCPPVLVLINAKGQMPHDQMARTLVLESEPPPPPHGREEADSPPAPAPPRGANQGITPPHDLRRESRG